MLLHNPTDAVRKQRTTEDSSTRNGSRPAVDRMDVPCRGIEQGEVGDEDLVGVHQLDEVASRVLELVAMELGPPEGALPIDGSIVPCNLGEKNHNLCSFLEIRRSKVAADL